jgi:spore germination cell wall hydrolase CwlJ-like protein
MVVSASLRDASALAALKPFQPASLKTAEVTGRESKCLAEAVYYEARGESFAGQMAVAEVVMNRVRSGEYPNTMCGVVYQGSERTTGCQFTFTCDGSLARAPQGVAWKRSEMIAAQVMMGMARPITHRATHYHTVEVAPVWSANLVETTRIGSHIFYRFPTRAEKEAQRIAQAQQQDATPIA